MPSDKDTLHSVFMTHTAGQLIRTKAHNTVYVHDPHSRSVDRNINTAQCVHDPHSRSVDKDSNTTQCVHDPHSRSVDKNTITKHSVFMTHTACQLIRTQSHNTVCS